MRAQDESPDPIVIQDRASALLAAAKNSPDNTWWDLQLEVSATPEAGEQAVATATFIGTPPGPVDMEWTIGNSVDHSASRTQTFTPTQPGALVVSVRGVVRGTADSRAAKAVLQVRGRHGFDAAIRIADQLARDEKKQTIVSAIFIAAAGYAIFQANFYGTFLDFMAATLWGFSMDVGVAKVREIAAPVLARPVPLPAAK